MPSRFTYGLMLSADKSFLNDYWRVKPQIFRAVLKSSELTSFPKTSFFNWCSKTGRSVRLFHTSDEYGPGQAKSGVLRNKTDVGKLFRFLKTRGESVTLHMNGVELVDARIFNLRQAIAIPYWWRIDDVIATLSSKNSGIGFHAGHEDGFIVQLQGVRRWRLWKPNLTPPSYRRALLAPVPGGDPKMLRTGAGPILDCTLKPGDALYIPPFFPHEGITLDESLSISIAWKGLAPASFLTDSIVDLAIENDNSEDRLINLCRLFPDSSDCKNAICDWTDRTLNAIPKNLQTVKINRSISNAIHNHFMAMAAHYSVL